MTASGHERGAQAAYALVVVEAGVQLAVPVAEVRRVDAAAARVWLAHWPATRQMPGARTGGAAVDAHRAVVPGRVPVTGAPAQWCAAVCGAATGRMTVVCSFHASVRMLAAFLPFADLLSLGGGELVALVVHALARGMVPAA
jgi:hypothetical protein